MTGAAKDAVDEARARGDKVGLVKVKTYRPFPAQALAAALAEVKAVGVVDRSVSFGWNCGPLYQDTITAMYYATRRIPAMSFIGGLAGADLTVGHFERVIGRTAQLARDGHTAETVWLNEKD
jgi:pyruvate ferredoxin oxidoreductase alpha subunit/phenylglyoxylate dehydrogenase alpha subunit